MNSASAHTASITGITSKSISESIVVLDYGSQYTQLIVRRLRELGVFAIIMPHTASLQEILENQPKALVFSGGPTSVYDEGAPAIIEGLFESDLPTLAICYGMQLVAHSLDGEVTASSHKEYGKAVLTERRSALFDGVDSESVVWMSHGDSVTTLPSGFEVIASTADTAVAAMANTNKNIFCLQFHPEVQHSQDGQKILENFLELTGFSRTWQAEHIVESLIADVQAQVGDKNVLLGISGGVDSSTLGLLLHKAIGEQLLPVFVDNGLLRQGELELVSQSLRSLGLPLHVVDAKEQFYKALAGVTDPEQKRKAIGKTFIDVFSEKARDLEKTVGEISFLAQGTLYPDVVESAGGHGAANIKSHHNVGGLPDDLSFELLEPFRTLFKDEVREIAAKLGMPPAMKNRHPFPGPGLAIRCLGDITAEKIDILQRVDNIFITMLIERDLYGSTWQALAVLTPLRTVGVVGDGRSYGYTVALRAVSSIDGMTADWTRFPHEFLADVSNAITNQVPEVSRVVYDITSKPPGTIEWE